MGRPPTVLTKMSKSRFLDQRPESLARRRTRLLMARLREQRRLVPGSRVARKRPAASRASGATTSLKTSSSGSRGACKRPAASTPAPRRPVPGEHGGKQDRRKVYPCCGLRRERCRCNWRPVEEHLDADAWQALVGRVHMGELKYVVASVSVSDRMIMQRKCPHAMSFFASTAAVRWRRVPIPCHSGQGHQRRRRRAA